MEDKYYENIKEKALKVEIYDKVRDYAKEKNRVTSYFEIGELISNAGREYGKNIINNYSEKLVHDVGKKYNYRTLYRMRKFYEVFSDKKLTPLVSKLSWSHYIELLSLKNVDEIIYYINISVNHNLNKRELQTRITNHEYRKLDDEVKYKLFNNINVDLIELIPNPIVIKVDNLNEKINEYALKQAILCNLDNFLKQLGYGFTYIGNEFKIKLGDRYNYIDIFLYNIKYKCYVVIELKVNELNSSYTGQIQNYMNYVDKNIKTAEENETVGIIICKKNNQYVIDYCSNNRIFAREYELV